MLKQCLLVAAIAACGGGSKSNTAMTPAKPLPSSECAMVASHVADVVMTFKEPPPTTKDAVAEVITKHCEQDGWSADAKKCFGEIKDEATTKPCIETLTKDQHTKVMDDMDAKMGHKHHEDMDADEGAMGGHGKPEPASAPPPPPPKSRAPASPKGKTGADPCEGGE